MGEDEVLLNSYSFFRAIIKYKHFPGQSSTHHDYMKTSLCKTCKHFIRIVVRSETDASLDNIFYDCTLQASILNRLTHRQVIDGYPLVRQCNQYVAMSSAKQNPAGIITPFKKQ